MLKRDFDIILEVQSHSGLPFTTCRDIVESLVDCEDILNSSMIIIHDYARRIQQIN